LPPAVERAERCLRSRRVNKLMLPKKERLTSKMFDRFFSSGRRYNSDLWQIVFTPGDQFQAAVVVGKKVNKSAVKRNKIRRQIYNLLYRFKMDHNLKGSYLILTKPTIKAAPFASIKEELHSALLVIEKKSRAS